MNNLKSKAGFTLVELIVVIAILAILAGVGTAAYTGYIEKAKEAKDTQILSAINTAFSAACTENSVLPTVFADTGAKTAAITVASGVIGDLAVEYGTSDADDALEEELIKDFEAYFEGNDSATLGYYTVLTFENGNFKGLKN